MRRLYQKIYLTIVASLVLVVLASGAVWRFGWEFSPARQVVEIVGAVAAAVLPPASAPRSVQAQAIARIGEPRRLAAPAAVRYPLSVHREVDPVIEAYKKDVDRALLRSALKLTPEQRIRELIKLQQLAIEFQKARGRKESP